MTQQVSRAGLPLTIPFAIPAYWTPEQAQAVIELLDDLRERIAAHYQLQLADVYREQQATHAPRPATIPDDDLPF
jgi:hypothetical protein